MLRLFIATLKQSILNTTGYKMFFIYLVYTCLLELVIYFFTNKFVDQSELGQHTYGVDYFSYVLIGYVFSDVFIVATNSATGAISRERIQGTFESYMISPFGLYNLLFVNSISSLWNTMIRITMILVFGILLGFRIDLNVNLLSGIVFLIFSTGLFFFFSMMMAGLILLDRRLASFIGIYSMLSTLMSGAFFPVQYFPDFLVKIIYYLPFPYAMINLRKILSGEGNLLFSLAVIAACTVAMYFISKLCFEHVMFWARKKGYILKY